MIVKHTLLNYICNHSSVVLMLLFPKYGANHRGSYMLYTIALDIMKRAHPLCTPAALAGPAALSHFTCIKCMFSPPVGGCAFPKTP